MSKGISIIVPAYDRPRLLSDTLDSLLRQDLPPDTQMEIIVVAHTGMKEAPAIVDHFRSASRIPVTLLTPSRPGLSFARNQGLSVAAFDHVAYFDDDVQVAPGWIRGYFDAIERFDADCVVGPVHPIFEQDPPPSFPKSAVHLLISPYSRRGDSTLVLPPHAAHEVPGCNFGVRREAALDVGAFDPTLGRSGAALTGGDDFEFGRRLVAAGKKVVYQPLCSVGHVISAEKLSPSWSRRRWYGFGIYERFIFDEQGHRHTARLKILGVLRMAKLALACVARRMTGRGDQAFERELELLRNAGFLVGPARAALYGRPHKRLARWLPIGALRGLSGSPRVSFLYHVVSDLPLPHVKHLYTNKTTRLFEDDLVSLKRYGEVGDYRQWTLTEGAPLLTFDDGYAECHSVVRPLLQKHGIPCIFFVTTDWIGNAKLFYRNKVSLCIERTARMRPHEWEDYREACARALGCEMANRESLSKALLALEAEDEPRIDEICGILGVDWRAFLAQRDPYLTREQVGQLAAEGFTIGAHGRTHRRLDRLGSEDAFQEIADSCIAVREWTGQTRVPLSLPHNQIPADNGLFERIAKELPFVDGLFGGIGFSNRSDRVIQRLTLDDPARSAMVVLKDYYAGVLAGRLRGHPSTRHY